MRADLESHLQVIDGFLEVVGLQKGRGSLLVSSLVKFIDIYALGTVLDDIVVDLKLLATASHAQEDNDCHFLYLRELFTIDF